MTRRHTGPWAYPPRPQRTISAADMAGLCAVALLCIAGALLIGGTATAIMHDIADARIAAGLGAW